MAVQLLGKPRHMELRRVDYFLAAQVRMWDEGDSNWALEGCTWHCFRVHVGGGRGQ